MREKHKKFDLDLFSTDILAVMNKHSNEKSGVSGIEIVSAMFSLIMALLQQSGSKESIKKLVYQLIDNCLAQIKDSDA